MLMSSRLRFADARNILCRFAEEALRHRETGFSVLPKSLYRTVEKALLWHEKVLFVRYTPLSPPLSGSSRRSLPHVEAFRWCLSCVIVTRMREKRSVKIGA